MSEETKTTIKFVITIVIAVVSTIAWMDNRFLTTSNAETHFAKVEQVDKLQKIITFQQLQTIWKNIEDEEKKPKSDQSKTKLEIYYQEENRLKSELQVK